MIRKIREDDHDDFMDKYVKRNDDNQRLIAAFNDEARRLDSIVYLDGDEDRFEIKFDLSNDSLIDNGYYKRGNAYIYPDERVFTLINQIAKEMGYSVNWNNTRTTGWLSFNI